MAVLLGAGMIALTAACGAEVAGTAQGGIPAAAGASSAQTSAGTESTDTGSSGTDSTETGSTGTDSPEPSVADPSPTADPETTESTETTGTESTATTGTESTETTDDGGTPAGPGASTASNGTDADYAFTDDYCTLMPKSYITGLQKDATRDKTSTCTYTTPESSKDLQIVTITGGFGLSYEELDESYNVDLAKVKIDGRDGFTWTTSSKSLYSALFNLPKEDGGEMSILVIITDDGLSLPEMKAKALKLAAEVSKEVPR